MTDVTQGLLADLPSLDLPAEVSPADVVRAPLPADRPVRWGILATGKIARGFAQNLALLPDARIAAVAARRVDSAREFAAEHGVPTAYGDYASLVADPDVDVVYVATPHSLHKEHVLLALEAGKPVLCEKALTLTAADAEELVAAATERRLFLMEAMWMRCLPLVRRLGQLVERGDVGTVLQVQADLGFRVDRPPTDRLLDPALGGGALLDMGVYPLTFAHLFLGEPARVAAAAVLADTGIDLNIAVSQAYDSGAVASLTASMTSSTPRTASIGTDRGRIDLPESFHHPTRAVWTPTGGEPETWEEPIIGTGLAHEAIEVMRCLRAGLVESPLVPHADTVAVMRQMDAIRRQVGVRYPGEPEADPAAEEA
jgi:predicted dehydrogenase